MSFLSSADRARAISQHDQLDALLAADEMALKDRLAAVATMRQCVAITVGRIRRADDGESDVDEIQSIDALAGDLLRQGLRYYPYVIGHGAEKVVRA